MAMTLRTLATAGRHGVTTSRLPLTTGFLHVRPSTGGFCRAFATEHGAPHRPAGSSSSSSSSSGGSGRTILAFAAIAAGGLAAFAYVTQKRADDGKATTTSAPRLAAPSGPTFDAERVSVIYVLGGPGAGKGTQCANLVKEYGFVHLSAGDLLRAEQEREGSEYGQMIKDHIKEGKIVPMEVTVALIENAMRDKVQRENTTRFLIDGFPRQMDQALKFDESVCQARFVLFFDCPEDVMTQRLLNRGKTSGRADDNEESIRKRFRTFKETSMPVVEYYRKKDRVVVVDATKSADEVYQVVRKHVEDELK